MASDVESPPAPGPAPLRSLGAEGEAADEPLHAGAGQELSEAVGMEVEARAGEEAVAGMEELLSRVAWLRAELERNLADAQQAAASLRDYVEQHRSGWTEQLFTGPGPCASVADLRMLVEAFAAKGRGEEAEGETKGLRELVDSLRLELEEARLVKSREERDLLEFRSVREKDSELQDRNLQLAQLHSEVEELRAAQKVHAARAAQSEAALGESARKAMELARQLDERSEQCRLLSDENVTLRLQLGLDSKYTEVVEAPSDPLSYSCAGGRLSSELEQEEQRFRDELAMAQFKFPGLAVGSENCRAWCSGHLSRQCELYRGFLHLFQDLRQEFPAGAEVEFISKTQAVGSAWNQREEEMRDADAAFHEREKEHTKHWEEKRLQLTAERDAKIRQLLEQGEKSQSKAEKQLLMQQAKLFGQRLDAQIERAWEEQRKERDARWAEHSRVKQESRQRLKDESLSVQQSAEGAATAADRFQDAARAKLASVEDAWLRNLEKASEVSSSALRHGDLLEALQAAGLAAPKIPAEGSQHAGSEAVAALLQEILERRVECRALMAEELEDQTLQQLRTCVEAFLQRETSQQRPPGSTESAKAPALEQAAVIRSLLQGRQHRVVADTIRRQFGDFLLVMRAATLGAAWLLPGGADAASLKQRGARLDLPPPPDGEGKAEGGLYEELLAGLLGRLLTPLHARHRRELLSLKRSNAREARRALEHLCQLEPDAVERARRLDLEEYQHQVSSKLFSDCERHLAEERRRALRQLDAELAAGSAAHRREALREEGLALGERRRWLGERLVVVEAQACISPGDKAMIQRLRAELTACEGRLAALAREAATDAGAAGATDGAAPPPSPQSVQVPGLRSAAPPVAAQQQAQGGGLPLPPWRPPPAPWGPGPAAAAATEAGGGWGFGEAVAEASQPAASLPTAGPPLRPLPTPRDAPVARLTAVSPEFGAGRRSDPSAQQLRPPPPAGGDGGSARSTPSFASAPSFGRQATGRSLLSEDLLSMAVDAHPLYGSPFAPPSPQQQQHHHHHHHAASSSSAAGHRSFSAPAAGAAAAPLARPLPPLRRPPHSPAAPERRCEASLAPGRPFSPLSGGGAQSARHFQPRGPCLGAPAASSGAQSARSLRAPPTPPPAPPGPGGKSARAMPPLLPPMCSPRAGALA